MSQLFNNISTKPGTFQLEKHALESIMKNGSEHPLYTYCGHYNDITNTAVLTVELQTQGHSKSYLTIYISGCTRAIELA